MMYSILKEISFWIRFSICYFTIEQYPIFADDAIARLIGHFISIYLILRIICYLITGGISSILGVKTPSERSVIYFFVHLIVAFIVYYALKRLTQLQILPF